MDLRLSCLTWIRKTKNVRTNIQFVQAGFHDLITAALPKHIVMEIQAFDSKVVAVEFIEDPTKYGA